LEIDPNAVSEARRRGLDVTEGSFDRLSDFEHRFDAVVCSHVLEHVHEPRVLLEKMSRALKPGGILYLSYPNPQSAVFRVFGRHWRGLEAPRHICLPTKRSLRKLLVELKCEDFQDHASPIETFIPSLIHVAPRLSMLGLIIGKFLFILTSLQSMVTGQDLVQLSCRVSGKDHAEV